MEFFQPPERRDIRYPMHLPVSIKLAHKEMHARSENISVGCLLLSSTFVIPKGANVEITVEVAAPARPATFLNARGKVLRVQPKAIGGFAVAIKLERSFKFALQDLNSSSGSEPKGAPIPQGENRAATKRVLHFAPAWHTET
jgi:hypothetical protein